VLLGAWLSFRFPSGLLPRPNQNTKEFTFLTLSQGVVHYRLQRPIHGRDVGASPLVVLVPGFSVGTYCYDELADALLAKGARVLQYDLYGRGLSDCPDVPHAPALFVGQLAELLYALGLTEKFDLVGYSMGGAIAASFASVYPDRIRSLVLFAPAGLPSTTPAVAKLVHIPLVSDIVLQHFRAVLTEDGIQKEWVDVKAHEKRFRRVLDHLLSDIKENPVGGGRALQSTLLHFPLDDVMDAYAFIGASATFPVLCFWGSEDDVCPYANHKVLQKLLPRTQVATVPKAKHALFVEFPDLVFPRLFTFFFGRQETKG